LPIDGTVFFLGTFSHLNNPIFPPSITSIALNFNLTLGGGATPSVFSQVFNFAHDETPNSGACPYGGANNQGVNINGCADRIAFGSSASSTPFTFGGVSYFLNIIGFSIDAGATTTPFLLTQEAFTTSADLYGNLVRSDPFLGVVPEPSTYALMAFGLAGLGVASRRRSLKLTA